MEKFYLRDKETKDGRRVELHRQVTIGKREKVRMVGEVSGWRLNLTKSKIDESLEHRQVRIRRKKKVDRLPVGEEEGVRLHLAFRGISNLMDVSRASEFVNGVYEMSREEAYYWYAKTQNGTAGRGLRSLRVLLAGVA